MIEVIFSDSVGKMIKLLGSETRPENSSIQQKDNLIINKDCYLGEVISLYLGLSMGQLSDNLFGEERRLFLAKLTTHVPLPIDKIKSKLMHSEQCLDHIRKSIIDGDDLRIWYSDSAED